MRSTEPLSRVMTAPVVAVDVDARVGEVLRCFEQYDFHHLPVLRSGRVVGILSSADLLKLKFFLPANSSARTALLDDRFAVERIMRQPPVTARAHTTVCEAAEIMARAGIHALPVVDGQEALVGIVTTTDIMRAALDGPPRRHDAGSPASDARADVRGRTVVAKPTDTELGEALATAELRYVEAKDPASLGKVLLYLHQRCASLEQVRQAAERWLGAGLDAEGHARLTRALDNARRTEGSAGEAGVAQFGLDPEPPADHAA
jgi:CBS domain-containing membrane protein